MVPGQDPVPMAVVTIYAATIVVLELRWRALERNRDMLAPQAATH
ncbi:MAG: hypothetical protein ACR2J7_04490 [Luteimonas sp.]